MASLAIPMDEVLGGAGEQPARSPLPPPAAAPLMYPENTTAAGFGAGGRNWTALGAITGLHVAMIALLLTTGVVRVGKSPPPVHVNFVEEIVQPQETQTPVLELEPVPTEVFIPDVIIETTAVPPPPTITVTDIPPAPKVAVAPTVKATADAPIVPPDFSADQLNNPGPRYPAAARRAREQGTVTLKVLVSPEGRATELAVATSSGSSNLDQAALATVKRWAFLPAKKAGKAVSAWVLVPVTFALGESDGGRGHGGGRGGRGGRGDHGSDGRGRGDHSPREEGPAVPGVAPTPTST